ncbi:MAG: hypothetical protein ACUVTP_06455 [Candidatus Fervidibacter sp.]|uniref:hypothetical protein n=1 Tax=Candidatus Fervidibacter sp. TaxID=3100871 RepID=UPI00404A03C5
MVKFVPLDRIPRVKIWAEEKGEWVRVWVEDNGIGILPEDRERIFPTVRKVSESGIFGDWEAELGSCPK